MGRAALCMRATALLAAAGMFIFLAEGISADNDIAEAVAARVLEPTEVVAEIPEEYNTLFPLQWGGGSLYQLKGRLATMGCMANTIWLYDNDKWHPYNQYQIPSTFASNVEFQNQYAEFIPAGTLWADCFRICEFGGEECLSFETVREKITWLKHTLKDLPCTDDFDPRVKQYVLSRLPHSPDVCIVKNTTGDAYALSIDTQKSFITIYDVNLESNKDNISVLLHLEIHELCHTAQHWHWLQQLQPNADADYKFLYHFNNTYGKEFIDLVGFTQSSPGEWHLPVNSVYRDIYSNRPYELSAELCAMYLLDAMGEPSRYTDRRYRAKVSAERDFDTSKYLTLEIIEWLETYMILPQIAEDAGDE